MVRNEAFEREGLVKNLLLHAIAMIWDDMLICYIMMYIYIYIKYDIYIYAYVLQYDIMVYVGMI